MPTAFIPAGTTATATLVTGIANRSIRVLAWFVSFSGTCNVFFQNHTGTQNLSGVIYGTVGVNAESPSLGNEAARGQFQTASGDSLDVNLSAVVAVGGYVVYEVVPSP